jgi:hypothetical protein
MVFQLTNEVPSRNRFDGRRQLWYLLALVGTPERWLFKVRGLAPIRMNGISKEKVERFIESQGARLKTVERYDPGEGRFHSYYYFLIKELRSSEL